MNGDAKLNLLHFQKCWNDEIKDVGGVADVGDVADVAGVARNEALMVVTTSILIVQLDKL